MSDSKPTDKPNQVDQNVNAEKITAPKKTKDPKRVEAGKKLAAISKAAKEKKMRNMIEMEKSLNDNRSNFGKTGYTVIIAAVVIAVAVLTLKKKENKEEAVKEKTVEKKQDHGALLENL